MRWEDYRQSDNVRGVSMGQAAGGVGIGGMIIAAVLYFAFGIDPRFILEGNIPGVGGPPAQERRAAPPDPNNRTQRFVSAVLATTEDAWDQIFQQNNMRYQRPALHLFAGEVQSACGDASAAFGPFYCPGDQVVYLDTSFFDELERRFRAPGDFAAAYVIGHEVGHHVQNLLGVLRDVQTRRQNMPPAAANELQVRVELQADCYAGVWANRTQRRGLLESGDVEEALGAASAIGDDTLQRRAQGRVVPESFTHGTSEQRVRWFMTGLRSGNPASCDTFNAQRL
jgi:predicted metalloprotease